MAHATLTITMPETIWIHQLSTAYPESTFRVLAAVPGSESGFALVRITGPTHSIDPKSTINTAHDST